ncbi:hypothetical protein UlMin_000117 [Ulmus minor]
MTYSLKKKNTDKPWQSTFQLIARRNKTENKAYRATGPRGRILNPGFYSRIQLLIGRSIALAQIEQSVRMFSVPIKYQAVDSWSLPFVEAFHDSKNVSFMDSWLLCRNPIRWLLLRAIKKSKDDEKNGSLKRQTVYSFCDHYYFRKELKLLNLVTGYIFLLDKFGRMRWQGFRAATPEELSSLLSCTSLVLEEN